MKEAQIGQIRVSFPDVLYYPASLLSYQRARRPALCT
jgi:hypothetical protein